MQEKKLLDQFLAAIDPAAEAAERKVNAAALEALATINNKFSSDAEWAAAMVNEFGPEKAWAQYLAAAKRCQNIIKVQAMTLQIEIKERRALKGGAQ